MEDPTTDAVIFVSAGMNRTKKRDHILARRQLYLNYGALSLATRVSAGEPRVAVFHGDHMEPEDLLARIEMSTLWPTARPILLSIPSFYALDWARRFCALLKRAHPASRLVCGGRWVVGNDTTWIRSLIPELDLALGGLAEDVINDVARGNLAGLSSATRAQMSHAPIPLNHRLVDRYNAYQPSIEVSRGCGMGCSFCEERSIPLSGLQEPDWVTSVFRTTIEQYQTDGIRPYLQASFFRPTSRWAARLGQLVAAEGIALQWRCETRVDAMSDLTVEHLARSGMKVIDLGLETASQTQIRRMNKARDPDRYLTRASQLLKACHANGVWVKANVLLYAGETHRTFDETWEWLDRHSQLIKGVSVGPVVAYGPAPVARGLLAELVDLGATVVDSGSADRTGITAIHPSHEIDAAHAEELSIRLSKHLMSAEDYFALKSFSYYPRHYTRADFDLDVETIDLSRAPFRVDGAKEVGT